ncbi:MAG: hypothetical protein NZ703_03200 [Gemmataceae bacterium]|nr:hypothetical protein [Gemmataceae bacterium]MCS7270070.1 hypothetical protein [Gemmataceae bacterium]MDW8243691.1 hypothetical protein [Thermogemmata sp.]
MKRVLRWCSGLLLVGMAATFMTSWHNTNNEASTPPCATASLPPACSTPPSMVPGGNYAEALARYRTNQPTHWRHILIQH